MLDKIFSPSEIEPRLYAGWEASGAFAADPARDAAPFVIMIPPPNVTGSLHMGHALTFTLQDALIRWRRMQGRDALWQPGTDHAGIATQMVVERLLAGEGIDRRALGREKFLDRVWQWKAESGGSITRQLRRLGASLDWPRERFTMDDGLSAAVREVFVTLYRQGLIYRDRRLVNWDPKFQSAISDLEVESREIKGSLWHIRYPLADDPARFLSVATTRPETMLGDTAVAVHPDDARYRDLIGRDVILPLVGRRIPIVADEHSDPEKGTGAVKITPAHDFNDFEVGRRHDLPMPSVIDREGRITLAEIAPDSDFVRGLQGADRFEARRQIVAELERLGLLERIEPHTHQVPHGDRSGVPIEPLLTVQWYCNAGELAKPAIAAVEQGRTKFVPQQWENTFFAWMHDIQPWCISRQLWWGHRIPAWYGPDGTAFVAHSEKDAATESEKHYGKQVALTQDEDVLDTWFSSALWPFSTLGWPQRTAEVDRYYPGDVLVTGFDIIFFWVARMMMMGLHFMDEVPFRHVYIHGLVRDERGQKMSKSKGNVMDPLELIDRYGADALRFTICALTGPGRDIKLGPSRVESHRSFVTKLWNAARFCEMNAIAPDPSFDPSQAKLPLTRWILAEASDAVAAATAALEAYRFDEYAAACYRFAWHVFCDWFLELAKPALDEPEVKQAAAYVLGVLLRLLHPAMPFVTEELWDRLGYGAPCSLIRAPWPAPFAVADAAGARAELGWVVAIVSEVRAARAELNIPARARLFCEARSRDIEPHSGVREWIDRYRTEIKRLAGLENINTSYPTETVENLSRRGTVQIVSGDATYVLTPGSDAIFIDLSGEESRLKREQAKARREAEALERKLGNAEFVARADPEVVAETRDRLESARAEVARLQAALARIG